MCHNCGCTRSRLPLCPARFRSAFFSRAKLATTLGTLAFIATFFPYYAVSGSGNTYPSKVASSLLPAVAFALSLDVIATLEDNGLGITAATLTTQFDGYVYATGLTMMFVDAVLFTLLGWYLDNGEQLTTGQGVAIETCS